MRLSSSLIWSLLVIRPDPALTSTCGNKGTVFGFKRLAGGATPSCCLSAKWGLTTAPTRLGVELRRAQPPRNLVENTVHDPRLVLGEEVVGDIDVLVDDNARRHVLPLQKLVNPRSQNGTQN